MKRLNHHSTAEEGCIVTFSNEFSYHFWSREGLKDAANYADKMGLKIRTISTPRTIYVDMQAGSRMKQDMPNRRAEGYVYFPEVRMLAIIGRADLVEANNS